MTLDNDDKMWYDRSRIEYATRGRQPEAQATKLLLSRSILPTFACAGTAGMGWGDF